MVQILNRWICGSKHRQGENTMTGTKAVFEIIYEDILGNLGLLLCKERIFDEKSHFYHP